MVKIIDTDTRDNEVFREVISYVEETQPNVILGVGSALDIATAGLYINLGVNFIVGSVLNPEVARLCNRRKVVYCLGCDTASEVSAAEELGVEICKVFPGSQLGGPGFVKAVKAPFPGPSLCQPGVWTPPGTISRAGSMQALLVWAWAPSWCARI